LEKHYSVDPVHSFFYVLTTNVSKRSLVRRDSLTTLVKREKKIVKKSDFGEEAGRDNSDTIKFISSSHLKCQVQEDKLQS
jgi:hypothetical protein